MQHYITISRFINRWKCQLMYIHMLGYLGMYLYIMCINILSLYSQKENQMSLQDRGYLCCALILKPCEEAIHIYFS